MVSKKITSLTCIISSIFILSNVGIAEGPLLEQLETQSIMQELEGQAGKVKSAESKPEVQQVDTPEQKEEQLFEEKVSSDDEPKESISHIKKILENYSGHLEIVNSQMFDDYVNNLPLQKLKNAKRVIESGTTVEAVKLINDYENQKSYQKEHAEMMSTLVKNYTGMNRQIRAERTIQNWIRKVEKNSVVRNLRIRETNSRVSTSGKYLYLVCYTVVKGSTRNEYSFLVDTSIDSVRSVWLNRKIRKNYNL